MLLKNILILVEGKKKSDSEFLSYNLMLNSGKKNCALPDKKKIFSLLCCPKKKILNETKNHNPPLQVKWSVPKVQYTLICLVLTVHCIYV